MAKIGFEKIKFQKQYNNQWTSLVIDGKTYRFRSKFESHWALYLQLLKENGHIKDWAYEQTTFTFKDELKGAKGYLIDFDILENDGTFRYEECKGFLEPNTITKLQRVRKYRPEVVIDLIMQRIPKKGNAERRAARILRQELARRVVDGTKILKQAGII